MALTHHWKFEDNGTDEISGAWTLTEAGSPTYTASGAPNKNKAIVFDGSTQMANKDDVNLTGVSAVTICGWVYPDTFTNNNCFFAIMRRNTTDADVQIRLRLSGTSGGITAQVRAGASAATESFNSGDGALVAVRWNFVAFTYNDPDVDVYTDSTADQSSLAQLVNTTHSVGGALAITASGGGDTDLIIGAGKNGLTSYRDYWDGGMDDWRIYDTALNSTELAAIRDDNQAGAVAASLLLPSRRIQLQRQLILH